ncbi:MAG TPA: FkbM family methyltransferase [Candidatus Methylomirabilis sp.]|nr:FkbM family methyltransferase [Candidatus Methylomirabilis sp.]
MEDSPGRLAQFALRWALPLAGLRRVPILGKCVSWAGARLVPRDALTWVQVKRGPAQGLWLHLNPRTGATYFEGGGEPEVQEALQRHLRAGMTFYDVGANIGFFSLLAGRLVGKEGRVVAFEADPEVAARLREHVTRNEMSWIGVEETAVWSKGPTAKFVRTDPAASPDRGLGHIIGASGEGGIEVNAVSLDEFAAKQPGPDFLKCDVEGAEVEVFHGARRLLQEKRPGIICEMHSAENRRALEEEFARHGYVCEPCGANHVLAIPR